MRTPGWAPHASRAALRPRSSRHSHGGHENPNADDPHPNELLNSPWGPLHRNNIISPEPSFGRNERPTEKFSGKSSLRLIKTRNAREPSIDSPRISFRKCPRSSRKSRFGGRKWPWRIQSTRQFRLENSAAAPASQRTFGVRQL